MTSALQQFRLDGLVAVVTGGAEGIGRATAELMAEAGATVAVFDRDATSGGWQVDVTDEAALEAAFAEVAARYGRVDILVNNAGIAVRRPADTLSVDDWNRVIAVNLTGMFLAARIAARHMTAGGAIVNTASIMGVSGGLYPNVAYQTSKGGVVNLTRALAIEWAPRIRVNAVAPTYVATRLTEGLIARPGVLDTIVANTPMGRLAEKEEIADAILFLASPAASIITGVILPVDGGFLAR